MPIVTVTVLEGYDADTRRRLGKATTDAVRSVVAAPAEAVTVIIDEVARENYLRGGEHRNPGPPRPRSGTDRPRFFSPPWRRAISIGRKAFSEKASRWCFPAMHA